MSLWRRAAAERKNKRPPLAVFYSVNTTGFVISPPHTARKGACEGGTFAGFPPSRSITRPQATTFAQQKCRTSKKETSKRMSLFCWCERWDLNPHDLTDTSTSSLPVCRFQHARERNLRYYNKIPLFVKRQPEKLPESFASRHPPVRRRPHGVMVLLRNCSPRPHRSVKGKTRQKTGYPVQTMASQRRRA